MDADKPAIQFPALREDLDLYPGPHAADGSATWTIHDPVRNAFFRVGTREKMILEFWRLANLDAIVEQVNATSPFNITQDDVKTLMGYLFNNELVQAKDAYALAGLEQHRLAQQRRGLHSLLTDYLFFRVPLLRPDTFLSATMSWVNKLFSPQFGYFLLFCAGLGLLLLSQRVDEYFATFSQYGLSVQGFILLGIGITVAKTAHEFGHAYAAKRCGIHVPTMGVAFLVMWPVLYTDVTEAWKVAARNKRLLIGAAGMLAEFALAAICTLLWHFTSEGVLRSVLFYISAVSWISTLLINGNPFLRWDGYYLCCDYLEMPNLHQRAFALARWRIREFLFAYGEAPPEYFHPAKTRALVVFSLFCWLYRLVVFIGIALLIYFFVFKLAGILLFLVEIYFFIARPILQELKHWWENRMRWRLSLSSCLSAVFFVLLLLIMFYPWQQHHIVSAVLRPKNFTAIYAPYSGQIMQTSLQEGATVEAGRVLIALAHPQLSHELQQAKVTEQSIDEYLSSQLLDSRRIQEKLVLESELAAARARRQKLEAQLSEAQIRAGFTGVILDVDELVAEGNWVNDNKPLAILVDPSEVVVEGFIPETVLSYVQVGENILFYPDNVNQAGQSFTLKQMEDNSIQTLNYPMLAVSMGGNIDVRELDGKQYPVQNYYRIWLTPSDTALHSTRVVPGQLRLNIQQRSYASRLYQHIKTILIRESQF